MLDNVDVDYHYDFIDNDDDPNPDLLVPDEDDGYLDTQLSPNIGYEYRVRTRNSCGYSDYTTISNSQKDYVNEDWLAQNDFDRSESMSALVGGTDYTFLQAYAMGLNPEGFSNSATPRVEMDFENGLVTFTY